MRVRRFVWPLLLVLATPVVAQTLAQTPALRIEGPWLRATPAGAKVAAGYLSVVNDANTPDQLIGGTVPFAGRVEVHEMTMSDGVMKMRLLAGGLPISPSATIRLKPGSYHLMFQDLTAPLKEGETVAGTLTFEKAGVVPVLFRVGGVGGPAPDAHGAK